jgi:hypothetical protein
MDSNPFINYYVNQAGSGISSFQGTRFQRGRGFFSNIFKNAIVPLVKFLGPKVLKTGFDIVNDVSRGEPIVSAVKKRGKRVAQELADDAAERLHTFAQTGQGGKRRKTTRKTKRRVKRARQTNKVSKRTKKNTKSIFS